MKHRLSGYYRLSAHAFWVVLVIAAELFGRGYGARFTVATWNLEFYTDVPVLGMPPKSAEAKRLIRQGIRELNPDVIALEEAGSLRAVQELRDSLKSDGLNFSDIEFVSGPDPNLHLAFLSRLPIIARNAHTNESFLYMGKRHRSGRGFGEIDVRLPGGQIVTLISAHLKSKRQVPEADEQGLREEESALLREKIDAHFARRPGGYTVVLGDFNDGHATRTLRTIMGRGRTRLFDTRPAEKNGDSMANPNPRYEPRRIVWTHYFAKEEVYSRIDYILTSQNLRAFYQPAASFVLSMPDWGAASDHRPICARFEIP